jgi:hypothetical protein
MDSPVVDAITDGTQVTGVVAAGKNGLEIVSCREAIDATGDCDLSVLSGAAYTQRDSTRASYVFRVGNVDTDRFIDYFRSNPGQYPERMDIDWTIAEALAQYDETGTFLFPHGGGMQMELIAEAVRNGDLPERFGAYDTLDAMQMHLLRDPGVCHVITGFVGNPDLDAAALSRSVLDGKRIAYLFTGFMKKYLPGFESACVSATADDLGIRGSRWIVGRSTFTREMKTSAYRCADAIGTGVAEINQKLYPDKRAWNAQTFTNDVFEIPLGCLLSSNRDNLIIGAGRGADSDPPLLLRTMVVTMITGQGAGTAAAIAAKAGVPVCDVRYPDVRAELIRQGVEFPG